MGGLLAFSLSIAPVADEDRIRLVAEDFAPQATL